MSGAVAVAHRRWPWFVLALALLLAAAAAAWWFLWLPNWRPALRAGERHGIDVSAHQGRIDWAAVAADDIDFAYIKAAEGGDFVDRRFATNWRQASEAGLERGAYHFFTLCTPGAMQARNFLSAAPPDPSALSPAVDLELAGNCRRRPEVAVVMRELAAFLDAVERAWAREAVLYVGADFEARYPVRRRLGRPLWHPRFLRRPDVAGWRVWQVHGFAHVDGIDGRVDLNLMRPSAAS